MNRVEFGAGYSRDELNISGSYSQTAPVPTVETINFGCPRPNGQIWGILSLGQRLDAAVTSGSASMYMVSGCFDGVGNLAGLNISPAVGSVGPGSQPAVTVAIVSGTSFTLQINNSTLSGNLQGFWHFRGAIVPVET